MAPCGLYGTVGQPQSLERDNIDINLAGAYESGRRVVLLGVLPLAGNAWFAWSTRDSTLRTIGFMIFLSRVPNAGA
jgi:hypothetical protein